MSDTFRSFTPRIIADYKLGPDINACASYARGIRPGEFNGNIAGLPAATLQLIAAQTSAGISVEEEKLDNFEMGLKGRTFHRRLTYSLAAYYGVWSNQHVSTSVSFTDPVTRLPRLELVTSALGRTIIRGVEAEGALQATDRLLLEGSFALNDTQIRKFFCAVCLTNITGSSDVRGNRIALSPKYTATLSASYRAPVSDAFDAFIRADYLYQGSKFATEANLAETGAAQTVNLRLGLESDTVRLEAYVRNLTDDDTYTSIERSLDLAALTFGNAISLALPERRTWGVRASYRF